MMSLAVAALLSVLLDQCVRGPCDRPHHREETQRRPLHPPYLVSVFSKRFLLLLAPAGAHGLTRTDTDGLGLSRQAVHGPYVPPGLPEQQLINPADASFSNYCSAQGSKEP